MSDSMLGQRFGRLTVQLLHHRDTQHHDHQYLCMCDCGNTKIARRKNLKRGKTKSCGCLLAEHMEAMQKLKKPRGMGTPPSEFNARHPLYSVWRGMKRRCYDESHSKYALYGGRGITVCQRWLDSFEQFCQDMGPRPDGLTIDRIDNDKPYEPGNCRWASATTQAGNRPGVLWATLSGESRTVSQWCIHFRIVTDKVMRAIRGGIDPVVAITEAVVRQKLHRRAQAEGIHPDYSQAPDIAARWRSSWTKTD